MTAEQQRLTAANSGKKAWKRWGPYLGERQWGTVREDYSADGNAWQYTTHDMARSYTWRWGEEGIGGVCDDQQQICLALALWNGRDPFLKERFFGLSGPQGNHGEDVKEYYFYLDSTPTHSYMKMLYKYPQQAFPYRQLIDENARRSRQDPEFELIETGIFDEDRYFDVFIEIAKWAPEDIMIRYSIHNRGPAAVDVHVLPHIWFRNTWAWWENAPRPLLRGLDDHNIAVHHPRAGDYHLYADGTPEALFCENESNLQRLHETDNRTPFVKDGINDYIVNGDGDAINPQRSGTRAALHYRMTIEAGDHQEVCLRLLAGSNAHPFRHFQRRLAQRHAEADAFYDELQKGIADADARRIQRQALAGMMWSKQYYYYNVEQWLSGDPTHLSPPSSRRLGRNRDWRHLHNADIISMPDNWEYPWYAAWDLAFHCIPIAMIDTAFAKEQLLLLTREWYMHPNGQLPAYEWTFSDVNPPVHGWAAWRVYKIDQRQNGGTGDLDFLERILHKLLLNFTWWVNRKDHGGNNIFQGGFLGLDNIGVFDRSHPLPTGGHLEQTDGTSWMAMYCLNLMRISLELAASKPVYQDIAIKFFEHFLYIAKAMNNYGGAGINMYDEEDQFYYDLLHLPGGDVIPLKVRSMVGLIPLFAVEILEPEYLEKLPAFKARLEWVLENRPDLAELVSRWEEPGRGERRLLSLLRGHRMKRLLKRMLDPAEFLSDYGVRALSRYHEENPYIFFANGDLFTVAYQPAESDSGLFGGNSNWRGPIWFPVNFLIIESLQKFHHYYGDDFKVEYPTGSGRYVTIETVADALSGRLQRIFRRGDDGQRPVFGGEQKFQQDPHFRDYLPFYEYFHGDNGRGVGAAHQTGWTGLIAKLLQPRGKGEDPR